MKKFITYILTFLLVWISTAYWADTTQISTPSLISATSNSLNVSWEKVNNALWYYIYYSETSWDNYKPFWDAYDWNNVTITWLKPSTTYYVVVTYLDKTTNQESAYSKEWVFNTKTSSDNKFSLDEVNVINWNTIELVLNSELENKKDAIREFKITQNNKEIVWVKETKLDEEDNKKLILTLDNQLAKWEYKITVIYLTDILWRNIEEWINWELKFIVTDQNLSVKIDDSSVDIDLINENIELNSWDPETTDNQYYWLAWKSMTWVLSNWEVVAGESKKLPQTWPESIFLIFVSLIFWLIYIKKRKIVQY